MATPTSAARPSRPVPAPTEETLPYWEAARDGRLIFQHCRACNYRQFYPRTLCQRCGSTDLGWMDATGWGVIYTFTVVHRPPSPAFAELVPYVCAVIELDEGVRMLSNVVDCDPQRIRIGQRVRVDFLRLNDDINLPVFKLVNEGELVSNG